MHECAELGPISSVYAVCHLDNVLQINRVENVGRIHQGKAATLA